MRKEKQIEEMAKVIHESDMNYNTTFPISMGECLAKHGAVRTNAGIALYNAGFRKQSGWISVEERLPEHGEHVLVYSSKYYPIVECSDLVTYMRMGNYSGVTHWMPLPEPLMMKGGAGK